MANKGRKNNVSHSKTKSTYDLSYSQLQESFENIQIQAIEAFKKITSNKRIFSHLQAKMLENENNMEALRKSMLDILKYKCDDNRTSWFGCETCHILQKESRDLKDKLNKGLQPKVTFATNTSKYDMPSDNPYRRYH